MHRNAVSVGFSVRHLMASAATAALLAFGGPAAATTAGSIAGGGSSGPPYNPAFRKFNPGAALAPITVAAPPRVPFAPYLPAGSATGQKAFLLNDLTCDTNAVAGRPGCSGPAGAPGNTVDYAASDLALSTAQIRSWTASCFGQSQAGNLIQVPAMGLGLAIGVSERTATKNGALSLTDADLCGVFSGRITDFGQLTSPGDAKGPLQVVYRTDAAEDTLTLTAHLAAVCPATDIFTPTVKFPSLFPAGVPRNFLGVGSGPAAALALGGCDPTPLGRLGYLLPGLTSLTPSTDTPLSCGGVPTPSKVVVAALVSAGQPTLPTVAAIADGLTHPKAGRKLHPPTSPAAGANPANWAPVVTVVSQGYPLVGYTFWVTAQCSANPYKSTTVIAFLKALYGSDAAAGLVEIENRNGYVALADLKATLYPAALAAHILSNAGATPWNTDIGNARICAGLPGR